MKAKDYLAKYKPQYEAAATDTERIKILAAIISELSNNMVGIARLRKGNARGAMQDANNIWIVIARDLNEDTQLWRKVWKEQGIQF